MAQKSNEKKTDERFRNWATIVYPDSAPDDWLTIVSELKIPAMVSPLHCRDIDPDGQIKKPHFHVLLMFEGKKSKDQFDQIISTFGGVGREIVQSIRGYARYLCHLDNPEKAQYSPSQILCFGGADYDNICNLPSDIVSAVVEMQHFIRENEVTSYARFMDICAFGHPDWHYLLCTRCSLLISMYIKSYSWEVDKARELENEKENKKND